MVQSLQKTITNQSSKLEALEKQVHAKSNVRLDHEKVAQVMANRVDSSLADKLSDKFTEPLKKSLSQIEPQLKETRKEVQDLGKSLDFNAQKLEKYKKLSWGDLARLALAVLPMIIAVFLVVGSLDIVLHALGLGSWFPWIWTAWLGVPTWWGKLLALIPALGLVGLTGWLIYKLGAWLYEKYRGW